MVFITQIPFFYCNAEVSCRVNRRYHVHWLIKTSFGPAYEAGIDASDGFRNPNSSYLLLRRVPPAICRLRTRVTLLLAAIVASLTRTTLVERPFFDSIVDCRLSIQLLIVDCRFSCWLSIVDSVVDCRFAALIHHSSHWRALRVNAMNNEWVRRGWWMMT
jgi:hypothetical protein